MRPIDWFISDTHFWHNNIIRYSNRPFDSVEEMNEEMIRRWNAAVRPEQTIAHLGDVALGPWAEWRNVLSRLNGYKILVVGNHERIFKGEKQKMQDRFANFYPEFFNEIHHNVEGYTLSDGTVVNLSHFPYEADHMENARHMEFRLSDNGVPLIHGHTHAEFEANGMNARVSRSQAGTPQVHVGADAWDYRPVAEAEVIDLLKTF